MKKQIRTIILNLCKNQDWDWRNHIKSVVKNAKKLAKQLHANEEVCEIAAWLHDIKKVRKEPKDHHVYGAEEAEQILLKLNYPKKKIKQVKHCILTHSSDKKYPPLTKEAKIVASADALAQFDDFLNMIYYVYRTKRWNEKEGKEWLIKKYQKNWNKLMPEAKKIAEPKYKIIKEILK